MDRARQRDLRSRRHETGRTRSKRDVVDSDFLSKRVRKDIETHFSARGVQTTSVRIGMQSFLNLQCKGFDPTPTARIRLDGGGS